jgi:hypothetical protein
MIDKFRLVIKHDEHRDEVKYFNIGNLEGNHKFYIFLLIILTLLLVSFVFLFGDELYRLLSMNSMIVQ